MPSTTTRSPAVTPARTDGAGSEVKNNVQRSTSETNDLVAIALRIASTAPKTDMFDEKTLEDAISIKEDKIKSEIEQFKKKIAEDIFFRFLAKLSIENYDDDFDFYYRYKIELSVAKRRDKMSF